MNIQSLDTDYLINLTKKAGDLILSIYEEKKENWEVSFKSDQSPLTLADKTSNEYLCSELIKTYPDIPIISEENKEIPYSNRAGFKYFWLIDPLDGTKEFIKRNGEFTVNLALVYKNDVVAGIVHVPAKNWTYWAVKGSGAFKIEGTKPAVKLQAQEFTLNDENLIFVSSRSHINEETEAFISRFKNPQNTSMGSSLKLLLVAEGKAHIYPRLGPTMEWDTAASQIIVEEAGGKVVDYESNEKFRYNKENLLNNYFVVYGNLKK